MSSVPSLSTLPPLPGGGLTSRTSCSSIPTALAAPALRGVFGEPDFGFTTSDIVADGIARHAARAVKAFDEGVPTVAGRPSNAGSTC